MDLQRRLTALVAKEVLSVEACMCWPLGQAKPNSTSHHWNYPAKQAQMIVVAVAVEPGTRFVAAAAVGIHLNDQK